MSSSPLTGDEIDEALLPQGFDFGSMSSTPVPVSPTPANTTLRRYFPPKADRDTFKSQEAFLESLSTTNIEDVDVNHRKCPICWKPFGEEADAGEDNSEQPVKLRCGHAFGHRCMAHTFAVQKTFTISLQPLSYRLGSRSHALGRRLQAFVERNSSNFDNTTDLFIKMLDNAQKKKQTDQALGFYWQRIVNWLLDSLRNVVDINFFENAVILDEKPLTASIFLSPLLSVSSPTESSALSEAIGVPYAVNTPSPHHDNNTNHREREIQLLRSKATKLIAKKLANIHEAYRASQDFSEPDDKVGQGERQYTMYRTVLLHTNDLQASSNKTSDVVDTSFIGDRESDQKKLWDSEVTMFLVTRRTCEVCCKTGEKEFLKLGLPKTLSWKIAKKVPDACPICQKVLFKKTRERCSG